MGRLFANAPGPRVSSTEATRLGTDVPTGAIVDRSHHRITLLGTTDHLVVLAGPSGNSDETFRIAGLVNPTITVRSGARISIELVNANSDTANRLVVTADRSTSSWMPMMSAAPASAARHCGSSAARHQRGCTPAPLPSLRPSRTPITICALCRATRRMAWSGRS